MMIAPWRLGAFALGALCSLSAAAAAPAEPATGLDRAAMNPAIRPQDDLFGAVNGKWLTGGGYGTYYASYDAGVGYHYSFAGWTSSGSDHVNITLYAAAIS